MCHHLHRSYNPHCFVHPDYSHGSNYSCHLQNPQHEGGEKNGGGENDRCNEITAGGEMYGGVENLWDDENDGGGENEGSQIMQLARIMAATRE